MGAVHAFGSFEHGAKLAKRSKQFRSRNFQWHRRKPEWKSRLLFQEFGQGNELWSRA